MLLESYSRRIAIGCRLAILTMVELYLTALAKYHFVVNRSSIPLDRGNAGDKVFFAKRIDNGFERADIAVLLLTDRLKAY